MGKGSCSGKKQGEMCKIARIETFGTQIGSADPDEFPSIPVRNKNFRQPLARTLEPGTLPEIFVDVERYLLSDPSRPSDQCHGAVSGPAQRIR